MSEQQGSSTEVAVREHASPAVPLPPMNDAEVAATFRTAKALAESGLFKDARGAGQAFAKILAGRDLGLTPFESMSALHVFDGKVEAGADLHATRVRQHPDYDYKVEEYTAKRCAIRFKRLSDSDEFLSEWTSEDTKTAGLEGKANHKHYPKAMNFARAMTQGVTTFCPEVMGGLRVYSLGEIPRGGEDVTAPTHDAGARGVELPMAVEAVLARARTLGHAGIASRAAAEFGIKSQGVDSWVADRTRDLNRFAAGRPSPETGDLERVEDPPDAEVVPDEPMTAADAAAHVERTGATFAEPTPEEQAAANALGQPIVSDDFLSTGPPRRAEPEELSEERRDAMRRRANDLLDAADSLEQRGEPEAAEDARQEAEQLHQQAGPLVSPDQEQMQL